MTHMISLATGFQSSVNIAFDINDDSKLKNYIPTKSALKLLEDILLSTGKNSTDRARILIGAYGKGKSHIMLTILSILMKKDLTLFEKLIPFIKDEKPDLFQLIQNYYGSDEKMLPVVVTGSHNSLEQAFLLALQRTLSENELTEIMPDTNYQAAVNVIELWKKDYPETYNQLQNYIDISVDEFKKDLSNFNPLAYEKFESLYPVLTSGSLFNPFIGFDVVELYEDTIKSLKKKGYTGIYVVYDEFSKYLENHISDATKNDTKILQDLAEKCSRSGETQLHLMLISHKDITSYIDRASKAMIDGWRGVSERFHHVYLNNNFTQSYEIITAAIVKDQTLWGNFIKEHHAEFQDLKMLYSNHQLFSDVYDEGIRSVIYDCYPLHPVSTFILPRLSERVAQNERTLFTFLSTTGDSTLSSFLKNNNPDKFTLATPDLIYDYFEPLLKQEVYSGNLHKQYVLTSSVLRNISPDSLEAKIVKTISLIYILEQFEKLRPTVDELIGIFNAYGPDEVNESIKRLVEDKYVVYLKRSNGFLRLKETSGIDIRQHIADMIEKRASKLDIKDILNNSNFDRYIYPSRYNDDKEMTRYFEFKFVSVIELKNNVNWSIKRENIKADGAIFGIIPENEEDVVIAETALRNDIEKLDDCIFVIPTKYREIRQIVAEYDAVSTLMQAATNDSVLFEDYEVIYDDLKEVIRGYIEMYTRPEKRCSKFLYNGNLKRINRRSDFTGLLSDICYKIYGLTPVINNEIINKNELTTVATKSRNKLITALLRTELEPNLGLSGSGQEVSIMRSTVLNNGIVTMSDDRVTLNLRPQDELLAGMLAIIEGFVLNAKNHKNGLSFKMLYDSLTGPNMHVGIRKGLIPIYLSVVLHEYKKEIVVNDRFGQVVLSSDTIEQINSDPNLFTLSYIDWSPEKESYLSDLLDIFDDYVINDESLPSYERAMISMKRWYMNLPKYTKNSKTIGDKNNSKVDHKFLRAIRNNTGSYELIFQEIPKIYGSDSGTQNVSEKIRQTRERFDLKLDVLKASLVQRMRDIFCTLEADYCRKMSLTSIIRDWCEKIDQAAFEQLFSDGTDRYLKLFKEITNDEDSFIQKVARIATDLRIEDWDEETIVLFEKNLIQCRDTVENFHASTNDETTFSPATTEDYVISFKDDKGKTIIKRFNKTEESKRGKLLYNAIISQLESMGQSITDQEKRQVLIDVLKEMC